MAGEQRTTEDLRATLFECITAIKNGRMDPNDAKAITTLADRIIQTAKLEMEYASTLSRLDKDEQGITVGPLLLTQKEGT